MKKTNNYDYAKFERILNAAIEVIGKKGYHEAKIRDISEIADVAEGTIYNYFTNKKDILVSIFKVKLDEYTKLANNELEKTDNPVEKIKILINYHFKFMCENPNLAQVFQVQLRKNDPDIREKLKGDLKNYFTVIDNVIIDGVNKGVFKKNINIHLAREMFFGTLNEVVINWLFSERKWNIYQDNLELCNMFVKAFQ